MVGTFLLALVVLETTCNKKSQAGNAAPLAIGGALFLAILAMWSFSSGCMNPARAFGPAIVSGHLRWLWLYLLAPTLGTLHLLKLCHETGCRCRVCAAHDRYD